MSKYKIVVTGASGTMGRNILEALFREYALHAIKPEIYAICNQSLSLENRFVGHPFIVPVKMDLRATGKDHLQIFENADVVIHCAAYTGGVNVIMNSKDSIVYNNTIIDLNMLRLSAEAGVKNFVYTSSTNVYPVSLEPVGEERGLEGDPDGVFYGIGWMKRYGERMALNFSRETGMRALILRPSNLYGEYDHFSEQGHVVSGMITRMHKAKVEKTEKFVVWGSPNVTRDLIFAKDYAYRVLWLLRHTKTTDVFNVCTGRDTTIGDLAKIVQDVVGYQGEICFDTTKPVTKWIQRVSPRKMHGVLEAQGCKVFTSLQSGIAQAYNFYLENYGWGVKA